MSKERDALTVINQRIYKELDIIEEESSKSIQSGAVIQRSTDIAMEMNFLRKAMVYLESSANLANQLRQSTEEREQYLHDRLKEEKAKNRRDEQ